MKLVIVGLFAIAPLTGSAAPRLVADVNQQPEEIGANPSEFVAAGGKVFFTGEDRVHGRELWVTDGTENGTKLVKDLRIGQSGSFPSMLRAVGSRVFFFADDGEHGIKLWSSDGDETVMTDPSPGVPGFIPKQATAAGGLLYFSDGPISPSFFGWGLWRSDGTTAGTWLLNPAQGSSFPPYRPFGYPETLTEMDGALFGSNLGHELWRSAGTQAETEKLADLGAGAQIVSMAGADGRLWITLNRGTAKELWSWFEDSAGMIATFPEGALAADGLEVRGNRAFFVSKDSEAGVELWTSDGTVTRRVADIQAGEPSSFPQELTWCGETLYFTADDGIVGRGLWASDGESVWSVKTWAGGAEPTSLVADGTTLFFLRNEGGEVLWRSDGSDAGTQAVKQVTTSETAWGQRDLMMEAGTLFFEGNDGQSGFELWSSDGTPDGTGMLRDQTGTRDGLIGIEPNGMAAWGADLVFCGDDGIAGEEPWRSDGTAGGTQMLMDVRPGAEDSTPARFAVAGGNLFFDAVDGVHGRELWTSGASGTAMVRDINPGSASAYVNGMAAFNGRLAFTAQDETESELWITDGNITGKIKGNAGDQLVTLGSGLLFSAAASGYDDEPWWTDGETTRLVKDLIPGSQGSSPSWFTRVGNDAYFQAYNGGGFRLWRTDGTEPGTVQVSGWQGLGAVYPLRAAGNRLFFFEERSTSGLQLWMAEDGHAALVRQIGDSGPDYYYPFPADPYVETCNGLLFFVANDGVHGDELWRSDGTPAGTVMVRDIRPGSVGSAPSNLKTVGGVVYFQANDGITGEELWVTNGTADGTRLVADLVPGPGGSAPNQLVLAGNRLFFSAVTEETGREPFLLEVGAILDFHTWTEASGLDGLDAAPSATPHADGVANLLKYAFGIHGAVPYHGPATGQPGNLPRISVVADGNGTTLQVEYARQTDSSMIYTAKRSTSLAKGSFVPMAGDELVEPSGEGWERVTRSERTDAAKCFGVVEVTLP
jgi:ELWxxDGT repeat protein